MTPPIFDMLLLITSLSGLFALWHMGLKPLFLDDFRDALFEQRDILYELGNSGRLDYESSAYRAVEFFLNSLIRYAHRISFVGLFLAVYTFDETKAFQEGRTPSRVLIDTISAVKDDEVKRQLTHVVDAVNLVLLPRYISNSSVMFIVCSLLYRVLRNFTPKAASAKEVTVATFESDAYRENQPAYAAAVG